MHISTKQNLEFEQRRIEALASTLEKYKDLDYSLFLLGDVFDRNKLTLPEIDIFYKFIDKVSKVFKDIKIIAGNHDSTCFKYLPQINFTYYDAPTVIDNYVLVGHPEIDKYLSYISCKQQDTKIIFTHARCSIEPYIKEEVSFELMSKSFDLVCLGDIHSLEVPYPNVHYTTEPTHNHYTEYKKDTCGYIIVDTDTLSVERVFTDLPYKTKVSGCTVKDVYKLLDTFKTNNLYKVVVEDNILNFRGLPQRPHIKYELVPLIVQSTLDVEEELKDLISSKVSIEDTLLNYTKDTYKYSLETFNSIKNRLMRNR
jgi:DNA repair exonuclease SbcCD nuclease subunit